MSHWQAQIDGEAVGVGSQLRISSPHHVVRMATADQISIETSGGAKLAAIVLDRTGTQMTLSMLNGRSAQLSITSDHSLEHEDSQTEFSRQDWRVDKLN